MRKWLACVLAAALLTVVSPGTANAATLGALTAFTPGTGGVYTMAAGTPKLRLSFQRDDVFRLELAQNGTFTDPANTGAGAKLVVKTDYAPVQTSWKELADRYEVSTVKLTVKVAKNPVRFTVNRADGTLVFAESSPLTWDSTATRQSLTRNGQEQFFGGGMQNGRLNHTGSTIRVTKDFDWDDGGNPNAVPYYVSTAGYGVFRDTFAPGGYAFASPAVLSHDEQRFDAYYFVAPAPSDLKTPLDRYTELTGRPMMVPIYGLEVGDADCYLHNANRGERTPEDAVRVAQGYVDNDMPRGWMLVNDGYRCGYVRLDWTGQQLRDRGIQLGLWTESALTNQEYEVRTAGVRVRKLDVAWVGSGYRQALTACEDAHGGIERYSDARGYAWMVEGWAGSQRCAVQWTGDHSGTLDAIRWQIPAIAGAGLSGLAFTAGDIDGIFGGSAVSYTRDLQWKAFSPVLMSMSGWAPKDKQPWRYGEPYTSINRKYLKLRERLLPYLYTYAAEAHRTGVPVNRAMVMEYPQVQSAWQVKDQFLAGRDFLVAPVYTSGETRNGIYLPAGTWVDYWSGRAYEGPQTLNGYTAPLDRLPLLVRAGAIVPMNRAGINNHGEVRPGDQLTLDLYPKGESAFDLYSDDGTTRAYQSGQSATQRFTVSAPATGTGRVSVGIGAINGSHTGKPSARPYELTVHVAGPPSSVTYGGAPMTALTKAAYDGGANGWYAEAGLVKIRTTSVSAANAAAVELVGATVIGGTPPGQGGLPYDNVGITDDAAPGAGNLDGSGGSFSRQRLAAVGVTPGARVTAQGVGFTWPSGSPDNVTGRGQRIDLTGQGSALAFLGTGTSSAATGTLTVHYADGTSAQAPLGFANWCCLDPTAYGSKPAFSHKGKNTSAGANQYPTTDYRVFYNQVPLDPAKKVTGFTMPSNTAVHVFAVSVTGGPRWASDLDWTSSANGWGPVEKDRSNGESAAGDGHPITLGGAVHAKGLGAHARSSISFALGGTCSTFTATIGVDDEVAASGSVVFRVLADGQEVYRSLTLTGSSTPVSISPSVAGAQNVELAVDDAGDGNGADHADWASAAFTCSSLA